MLKQSPFWPMHMALSMAERAKNQGEVPVGAVLVHKQRIIARAHNQMHERHNPLAHAEMLVVLQGLQKMKTKYLSDCQLYVTLQPCAFCIQGLILARVGRVFFGAYDTSAPIPPSFEIIGGIQEQACQKLLWDFFKEKRQLL